MMEEQREVGADLRKERIQTEGDVDQSPSRRPGNRRGQRCDFITGWLRAGEGMTHA
jgi:hypothetical protein